MFAAIGAFISWLGTLAGAQFALTVLTLAYSMVRQRQVSKRMRDAQDAAKGVEVPVEAEVKAVPVVYGRNMVGGIRVFHRTADHFKHSSAVGNYPVNEFYSGRTQDVITTGTRVIQTIQNPETGEVTNVEEIFNYVEHGNDSTALNKDHNGDNHEFLFVNQAICMGGIEEVTDVKIDPDRYIDDPDFHSHALRINCNLDGGNRDPMMYKNFPKEIENANFSKVAYAAMVFRINRDNPQYQSGVPQVQFFVRGLRVNMITRSGSPGSYSYALTPNKGYTNNPAYCLLDYLTNNDYGLGENIASMDLESFYDSAQVCDKVVQPNVRSTGRVWVPTTVNGNGSQIAVLRQDDIPTPKTLSKGFSSTAASSKYTTPIETKNEYVSYLNSYGVWENDRLAHNFTRTYNVEFDISGSHTVYAAVDYTCVVKIDGTTVLTSGNEYTTVYSAVVNITAGVHSVEVTAVGRTDQSGAVAVTIDDSVKTVFNLKEPPIAVVRDLPLYECNLSIDPETPIRDNIENILETMSGAELVWSDGKYKLLLQYPSNDNEVIVADSITDDDIVRESFSIKWPSSSERLNFCTIKFSNEALNFKDDTISWPPKTGALYQEFLAEDNLKRFEADFFEAGIKDKYHALAKAEERVRRSRTSVTYAFSVKFRGIIYEPGDIIKLNSDALDIVDEFIQIQEIKAAGDGSTEIAGVRFDWRVLAWNVKDDENVVIRSRFPSKLIAPYPVTYTDGVLSWVDQADTSASSYEIYYWYGGSSMVNGEKRFTEEQLNNIYTSYTIMSKMYEGFYDLPGVWENIINWLPPGTDTNLKIAQYGLAQNSAYFSPADSNAVFMTKVYNRFLKREPDKAGLDWWVAGIVDGVSRAQVITHIVEQLDIPGTHRLLGTATGNNMPIRALTEGIYVFAVRGKTGSGEYSAFGRTTRMYDISPAASDSLARKVEIVTGDGSSGSFITAESGGNPEPATITFKAIHSNFSNPAFKWSLDGVVQGSETDEVILNSFAIGQKVLKVVVYESGTTLTLANEADIFSFTNPTADVASDFSTVFSLRSGSDAYNLWLSNENQFVSSDGSGVPDVGELPKVTYATVIKGSTVLPGSASNWSISSGAGYTASISNQGVITVSALTINTAVITVTAFVTATSTTLTRDLIVTKLRQGADGLDGIDGVDGANGYRTAFPTIYKWWTTQPTAPNDSSTYTWSTGLFTPTPSGWTLAPSAPVQGQTLWSATVSLNNNTTDANSNINWNNASISPKGYAGEDGTGGSSAKLIFLSSDRQIFTYNSDNVATPSGQTVTFTATTQNTTGSIVWAVDPIGATITNPTANTAVLTAANFGANQAVTVTASVVEDGIADFVTVVRLKDGAAGVSPVVANVFNEAILVKADGNGVVQDFSGAQGKMTMYSGLGDVSTTSTFTKINQNNVIAYFNTAIDEFFVGPKGAFKIISMSADVGTLTIRGSYNSVDIDRIVTIAKAFDGADGTPARNISLTATSQVFTYDNADAPVPSNQTITFKANRQNLNDNVVWAATGGVTLTTQGGAGNSDATLAIADFGANTSVTITASSEGFSDYITITKIKDAAVGLPAQGVSLTVDRQVFTFSSGGEITPVGQVATFKANRFGLSNNVVWTTDGDLSDPTITGSGVGNVDATLSAIQFGSNNYVKVIATCGAYTDFVTLVRLKDGNNGTAALVGDLTNDSVDVTATSAGVVTDTSTANGNFKVYLGITDVTAQCTFAVKVGGNASGLSASIDSTGYYTINGAGSWPQNSKTANVAFEAVHASGTVVKVLSISKNMPGATGASAKGLGLTADRQIFSFFADGTTPAVGGQAVVFTANRQNLAAGNSWAAVGDVTGAVTLTGQSDTNANLSIANFGTTNNKVTVTLTADGISDTVTIIKVKAGADGSAFGGYLTNEAHIVGSDSGGNITDWTGATGSFKVFNGQSDITAQCTFAVKVGGNTSGLTGPLIGASSGVYTITGASSWSTGVSSASIIFLATHTATGVIVEKTFSLSKANAGAPAVSLRLTATKQIFTLDKNNAFNPLSQSITINALRQNSSATIQWTVSGDVLSPTPPANGSTSYVLNETMFGNNKIVTISVTIGNGVTDTISIVRVQDGQSGPAGLAGYLTNDAHSLPADSSGVVLDWAGAGGNFNVFYGLTDVTSSCIFSVFSNPNGLVPGASIINSTSGAFAVTAAGSWGNGSRVTSVTLAAAYTPPGNPQITIYKTFTMSKSMQGAGSTVPGAAAKLTKIVAPSQIFNVVKANAQDNVGTATPSSILLTAVKQNHTDLIRWSLVSVTSLGGTGTYQGLTSGTLATADTLNISYSSFNQFASSIRIRAEALTSGTPNGIYDEISIVKVFDGLRGSMILSATGTWSDGAANIMIQQALGLAQNAGVTSQNVLGDTVTLTPAGGGASVTKYWSSGSWNAYIQKFDGNVLVNGTVSAQALAANSLWVNGQLATGTSGNQRIEVNTSGSNRIKVYDASNRLLSSYGDTGLGSDSYILYISPQQPIPVVSAPSVYAVKIDMPPAVYGGLRLQYALNSVTTGPDQNGYTQGCYLNVLTPLYSAGTFGFMGPYGGFTGYRDPNGTYAAGYFYSSASEVRFGTSDGYAIKIVSGGFSWKGRSIFDPDGSTYKFLRADGNWQPPRLRMYLDYHATGSVPYTNVYTNPSDGITDVVFGLHSSIGTMQFRNNDGSANIYLVSVSDRRIKEDIQPEKLGLSFINSLKPTTYRLKRDPVMKHHGFIAQDVENLIEGDDDSLKQVHSDGTKGIDYMSLISPLVVAIQELSANVNRLNNDNTNLRTIINNMLEKKK